MEYVNALGGHEQSNYMLLPFGVMAALSAATTERMVGGGAHKAHIGNETAILCATSHNVWQLERSTSIVEEEEGVRYFG